MVAVLLLASAPATAQELYALWGGQRTQNPDESTYSYSFEYLHNLSENLVASFTWLNEGHVTNHHRDGHGLQLWYRWLTPERRFTFSVGVGPYRYYDTTVTEGQENSTDAHGWGVMGSAAAHWYFHHPWVLQLRYNYNYTSTSITTQTYEIGFGYQFDLASHPGPVVPPAEYGFVFPERSVITAMIGESIVNNSHSPTGAAWAIEYRYRLTPYIDATAAVIDEGDASVVKRKGVTAEIWLVRDFVDRASLGLGFGPYLAHDADEQGSRTLFLGFFTMELGYRWTRRWSTRFYWYRTVTTNGRDSDVLMVGLGYNF